MPVSPAVRADGAPPAPTIDPQDDFARRRVRVVLTAAAGLVVVVMLLPILTSFTSVLDGVVGGVGVAYIVGFGEFVLALAGAALYSRWLDRVTPPEGGPDREQEAVT
jgi:uncharacterized membrane protein (DUF485 family)